MQFIGGIYSSKIFTKTYFHLSNKQWILLIVFSYLSHFLGQIPPTCLIHNCSYYLQHCLLDLVSRRVSLTSELRDRNLDRVGKQRRVLLGLVVVTNNNKFSTEQFQSNIRCSNMSLLVAKSLKKQLKVFPSASP